MGPPPKGGHRWGLSLPIPVGLSLERITNAGSSVIGATLCLCSFAVPEFLFQAKWKCAFRMWPAEARSSVHPCVCHFRCIQTLLNYQESVLFIVMVIVSNGLSLVRLHFKGKRMSSGIQLRQPKMVHARTAMKHARP